MPLSPMADGQGRRRIGYCPFRRQYFRLSPRTLRSAHVTEAINNPMNFWRFYQASCGANGTRGTSQAALETGFANRVLLYGPACRCLLHSGGTLALFHMPFALTTLITQATVKSDAGCQKAVTRTDQVLASVTVSWV